MAKVKITCVEKTRDRAGNITQYVIKDDYGKIDYLNREKMIKMLKNKNYDVVNLQIDAAGRIVDKAVETEKLTLNKKNEPTDDLTLALTKGIDLVPKMYDTEYLNKLQSKCEELISKGYMFTHMYSRHTGNVKYNFIVFYTKNDLGTVDRKIYTTIENMVNSYNSVSEAVQDLEMKDSRFGIVDLLDDAIIHAFGSEEKMQNYIRQQLDESNCIDCNSLINYIFRNVNNNRLYDYGSFSRKRSYNEFNSQYRKVVKHQIKRNKSKDKKEDLYTRILTKFNLQNSIFGMFNK